MKPPREFRYCENEVVEVQCYLAHFKSEKNEAGVWRNIERPWDWESQRPRVRDGERKRRRSGGGERSSCCSCEGRNRDDGSAMMNGIYRRNGSVYIVVWTLAEMQWAPAAESCQENRNLEMRWRGIKLPGRNRREYLSSRWRCASSGPTRYSCGCPPTLGLFLGLSLSWLGFEFSSSVPCSSCTF